MNKNILYGFGAVIVTALTTRVLFVENKKAKHLKPIKDNEYYKNIGLELPARSPKK
tara:strand:- start:412 stop:579 length:168 start_codon:yes stop_codon:yes gene_type:complete